MDMYKVIIYSKDIIYFCFFFFYRYNTTKTIVLFSDFKEISDITDINISDIISALKSKPITLLAMYSINIYYLLLFIFVFSILHIIFYTFSGA